MKKLLFAAAMAVGMTGCGLSAEAACKEFTKTTCARTFECFDSATKSSAAFVAIYGSSESECVTKLTSNACATVTNEKPCEDSSKKYDAQKAAACLDDLKKASCATLTGGTFSSGNCDNTCT